MKKIILIAILISQVAIARQEKLPPSFNLNVFPKDQIETVQIKPVDVRALIKASNERVTNRKVYQIGTTNTVNITPFNRGEWKDVPNGKLWKLRFNSKGATDISFGFSKYNLPEGAELYLSSYHDEGKYYDGPYTSRDNKEHNQFWTAALPGGDVAIELFLPEGVSRKGINLNLTNVVTGFRDIFKIFGGTGLNVKAGSCNNNVVCSEADPWRDEIRSVAHYTFVAQAGGSFVCTGSLVMNTRGDFKPYFLTAAHCDSRPETVVTYWNYENANCSDPVNGSTKGSVTQTISGSTLLANKTTVDARLLELSSQVPESFNPYWAGWDRSGTVPSGSVGIHHPSGDEKVISFNTDSLTTVNSCIGTGGINSHWRVNDWEDGTTEGGSSGSGLWDPQTHNIVGVLSGGFASCDSPQESDCYGKLSFAWSDGSNNNATQLQPWLDPVSTGQTSINGSNNVDFTVSVTPSQVEACVDETVELNINLMKNNSNFNSPIALSLNGLPSGANANFSNSSLNPSLSSVLTLSNFNTVTPNEYSLSVVSSSPNLNQMNQIQLKLFGNSLQSAVGVSPGNNSQSLNNSPELTWSEVKDATSYLVEVSTDANFNTIEFSKTVATNSVVIENELNSNTQFFWRVRASNKCATSSYSNVFSFTTPNPICVSPNTLIPDNAMNGVNIDLNVPSNGALAGLVATVESNHSYPGDLKFTLTHGSTTITLMDRPGVPASQFGCDQNGVNAIFNDSSSIEVESSCAGSPPGISGNLKPDQKLSSFNGSDINGLWRLNVSDLSGGDTGNLQKFCIIPMTDLIFKNGFEAN